MSNVRTISSAPRNFFCQIRLRETDKKENKHYKETDLCKCETEHVVTTVHLIMYPEYVSEVIC